jgi:hypothetical protein
MHALVVNVHICENSKCISVLVMSFSTIALNSYCTSFKIRPFYANQTEIFLLEYWVELDCCITLWKANALGSLTVVTDSPRLVLNNHICIKIMLYNVTNAAQLTTISAKLSLVWNIFGTTGCVKTIVVQLFWCLWEMRIETPGEVLTDHESVQMHCQAGKL